MSGNLPITGLLGVSSRKAGGPEKCGQDMKIYIFNLYVWYCDACTFFSEVIWKKY